MNETTVSKNMNTVYYVHPYSVDSLHFHEDFPFGYSEVQVFQEAGETKYLTPSGGIGKLDDKDIVQTLAEARLRVAWNRACLIRLLTSRIRTEYRELSEALTFEEALDINRDLSWLHDKLGEICNMTPKVYYLSPDDVHYYVNGYDISECVVTDSSPGEEYIRIQLPNQVSPIKVCKNAVHKDRASAALALASSLLDGMERTDVTYRHFGITFWKFSGGAGIGFVLPNPTFTRYYLDPTDPARYHCVTLPADEAFGEERYFHADKYRIYVEDMTHTEEEIKCRVTQG